MLLPTGPGGAPVTHALRPSFAAMAAVEADTGVGLIDLAKTAFERRALPVTQLRSVVHRGLEAAGCPLTADQVGDLAFRGGLFPVVEVVVAWLLAAVTGGQPSEPGDAGGGASGDAASGDAASGEAGPAAGSPSAG